ncbi:MAG TPA: hypothetical protein VJ827_08040 [Rubrobacter sp.]|nr:hypothetical protein [Rubrobacter sp.]
MGSDQHKEAWQRFMEAEERELANRQEGHLRKLLGFALPDESAQEIRRLAEEDRRRALEGLVELIDKNGQITYKHIDELTPQDREARIRAEGKLIQWLADRIGKRPSNPHFRGPLGP